MADDIPVIPKAQNLFVNSGNIVNWNRLKRKPTQNPTEEISDCISSTFQTYLAESDKNELQYLTDLNCVHKKYKETVPKDDRGDYKLTVKLFLCSSVPTEAIIEAVERALEELDVTFIESVLLAFPETDGEQLTLQMIQPYWKAMEKLVCKEIALSIGLADLDKNLLEQLYEWAEIKPVVNQVNLDSCCVMPIDLVEFAKTNDIQLLTHNDPRNVLPVDRLQGVLQEVTTEKDGSGWEPLWVLRYSLLVKCRGIVKSKGYLLKATKDTKRRK